MPELPEVETIRRQLFKNIVGKKIAEVRILEKKQFIGEFDDIIGAQIVNVWRRAKLLGFGCDNKKTILIHLKLTGQLVFVADHKNAVVIKMPRPLPFGSDQLPGRTTRIIIRFADGSWLFFNDLRKFGWVKVIKSQNLKVKNLGYGPEPLGREFTVEYLKRIFSKTRRTIKIVLMDQKKIAGIGNIYANEVLFEAKIDPRRTADSLDNSEIKRLCQAIVDILKEAIRLKGTSAADDAYVQPNNAAPGNYQRRLQVYQREGKECFHCGGEIVRIKQGGRSTFFCPHCQI